MLFETDFAVNAVDMTPPVIIDCPQSVTETISLDDSSGIVTWAEPTAVDNAGGETTVLRSHEPGTSFPVGTTEVFYLFIDQNGNEATCSFAVIGNGVFSVSKVCIFTTRQNRSSSTSLPLL